MAWHKTLTLYCDTDGCDAEVTIDGPEGTQKNISRIARNLGWSISHSGYATCEECNYTGQDLKDP